MRRSMGVSCVQLSRYVQTAAVPAIVTFLVAGIWHGDGWTCVIYGLIHGFAIAIYLGWRELKIMTLPTPIAWGLTMAVVVTGLVVFRADGLATATTMLGSMWMPSMLPSLETATLVEIDRRRAFAFIVVLGAIGLLLPNTQQILHGDWVSVDPMPPETGAQAGIVKWRPEPLQAVAASLVCCLALTSLGASSAFLYYQF